MTAKRGPGGAARKGRSAEGRAAKGPGAPGARVGRYTPPDQSGRYTAPVPRGVRHSPAWFGGVVLTLLVLGVLTILLNYLGVLPYSVTSWYLLAGLALILVGFVMATRYR